MRKLTFTVFIAENDKIEGYLFDVTRVEATEIVRKMKKETGIEYYIMDGYIEK